MLAYIIRRVLLIIPTLFGIMVLNFLIVQAAPGGPIEQIVAKLHGTDVSATARFSGSSGGETAARALCDTEDRSIIAGMRIASRMLRIGLIGASLFCCGIAQAVDCGTKTVGDAAFTVCRVDLKAEHLELLWRDDAGRPFRQFSALRHALVTQGKEGVPLNSPARQHLDAI